MDSALGGSGTVSTEITESGSVRGKKKQTHTQHVNQTANGLAVQVSAPLSASAKAHWAVDRSKTRA